MENEIKTRSIRADNESFEKFKIISEEFPNQAQALASLISVYEVEKSKAILPERQAEIENFTSHVQKLNEIYNHSLLLNQDAEMRIRAEFGGQLASKDIIIRDLQEKVKSMEQLQLARSEEKDTLNQLEKELTVLRDEKKKNDDVIKSLTEVATEYKLQAKENETLRNAMINHEKLETELKQHVLEIESLKTVHREELERIAQEQEERMNFMKEQIALNSEKEILSLREEYNAKINGLHESYQDRINDLLQQREQPKEPSKRSRPSKVAQNEITKEK